MSYQVAHIGSPHGTASLQSSSHMDQSTINPLGSSLDLMNSPIKLERSLSHSSHESLFPPMSPQSSHHSMQMSTTANFGSSQGSDIMYISENDYVIVSSPSRASTNSPPIVVNPTPELGNSSPGSEPSQSRSNATRKANRRRTSSQKLGCFMDFSDESLSNKKPPVREGKNGKKIGGRQKGSHLDAQTAHQARVMRAIGSCWVCVCQREKVNMPKFFQAFGLLFQCERLPGSNICVRCNNRKERGVMIANGHIGCTSHKLGSFQSIFVPGKSCSYHIFCKANCDRCIEMAILQRSNQFLWRAYNSQLHESRTL